MLGSRPFYQAKSPSIFSYCCVFAAFSFFLSGCAHKDLPSSTAENSGNPGKPVLQQFDHQRFTNTTEFTIPNSNVTAKLPRVKAPLSSGRKGNKTQHIGDIPPYILIEADEVNKWRLATVQAPAGGRTLFAAPMRLPISATVPVGQYIVLRPVSQIQDDPDATAPQAYLFEVIASAEAKSNQGNLLTLRSGVTSTTNNDWVVPLDYLDQTGEGISSVVGKTDEITILSIAPGRSFGANGLIAIIKGGVQQGISVGETFTAHGSRLDGRHSRAVRDSRDVQPEGNAKLVIIQSSYNYALAEIQQSSQAVIAGDILRPIR